MNFVKGIIKILLLNNLTAKIFIRPLLKLHNYIYRCISNLVVLIEPDKLHPKHRIIKYHHWFLNNINTNWIILDVGCGNGALSYDLAHKAKKVIGMDINARCLIIANKQFKRINIEYMLGDIIKFDFNKMNKIDCAVISNVLEHIKDRSRFLTRIKKISNRMLIRVPLINRDWITAYKKEMGVQWRLDKTHFTEYTFESFEKEIFKAGLVIKDYKIEWGEIYAAVKPGKNKNEIW